MKIPTIVNTLKYNKNKSVTLCLDNHQKCHTWLLLLFLPVKASTFLICPNKCPPIRVLIAAYLANKKYVSTHLNAKGGAKKLTARESKYNY